MAGCSRRTVGRAGLSEPIESVLAGQAPFSPFSPHTRISPRPGSSVSATGWRAGEGSAARCSRGAASGAPGRGREGGRASLTRVTEAMEEDKEAAGARLGGATVGPAGCKAECAERELTPSPARTPAPAGQPRRAEIPPLPTTGTGPAPSFSPRGRRRIRSGYLIKVTGGRANSDLERTLFPAPLPLFAAGGRCRLFPRPQGEKDPIGKQAPPLIDVKHDL